MRRSCRAKGVATILHRPLPLLVVAAETGYAFSGLSEGYWPVLAARIGTDLGGEDRQALVAAYAKNGFAAPDDTAYARRYRLIAWPLSNAVAPRQIHAGIAQLLREVALSVSLDDRAALGAAILGAARRRASPRLVDWASNPARSGDVARAMLARTDGQAEDPAALCPALVARLREDMQRTPQTRAPMAEARRRVARHTARTAKTAQPLTLGLSFGPARAALDLMELRTRRDTPEIVVGGLPTMVAARAAVQNVERTLKIEPDADILFHARGTASEGRAMHWPDGTRGRLVDTDTWWLLTPHERDDPGARRFGRDWLLRLSPSSPDHHRILERHGLNPVALTVTGGAPQGSGNGFTLGVPVGIETTDGEGTEATLVIGGTRHAVSLPEEGVLLLDPPAACTVTVEAQGEKLALSFEGAGTVAPALSLALDPAMPTPEDLHGGRVLVHLTATSGLDGISVRGTLSIQGQRTVSTTITVPTLPATLGPDSPLLAPLRDALAEMEAMPGEARLCIDAGIDRLAVDLIAPDPLVRWEEEDGSWRAFDAAEEDGDALDIRAVSASDPLAVPQPPDAAEGARLLLPTGTAPLGGLIVAPRRMQGGFALPADSALLPATHRRLIRSDPGPGLLDEMEAWLGWSCGAPAHVLAVPLASGAAALAEAATVQTLCGAEWLKRERDITAIPSFPDLLAAEAIRQDLVGAASLRMEATVTARDLDALRPCLSARFAALASHRDTFRPPCGETLGEALDAAVDAAWEDIDDRRAAGGLDALSPDTFNPTGAWDAALAPARALTLRPDLQAMIAPAALREAATGASGAGAALDDLAVPLSRALVDRGRLAGQTRAVGEAEMTLGLALWLDPARFARAEWRFLASALLRDRMAARAIRLVTILRRSLYRETT